MDERIERQELFCHNCGRYVQFPIDLSINGNHVLKCPNCKHEHCRVVRDGVITDDRWDRRNGPIIPIQSYSITTTAASVSVNCWVFSSATTSGF